MINKIINGIVIWLIKNEAISEDDSKSYEYAICSMIFLSLLFIALLFGIIMGIPLKAVLMIISFMLIRKYSGGYHMKRAESCLVIKIKNYLKMES